MPSLQDGMRYFVEDKHFLSSLSIAFGDSNNASHFYQNADESTVYDLASLTKLFTLIAVMQLKQAGKLVLSKPLGAFHTPFHLIENITIERLLSYQDCLQTDSRIDQAIDRTGALECLFRMRAYPHSSTRYYSDLHAMVLKYVVQSITGMPFFDYIKQNILAPCGMQHTFATVPQTLLSHTQSYSGEHRIENGQYIVRDTPAVGQPHDPKALLISPNGSDLCGHAGLFSTLDDMSKLCQALLARDLLNEASLAEIAQNRTGVSLGNGKFTQHLGYLCYVKHPNQYDSEIPAYMTERAFGLSGFTGNHISIDPKINRFNVFLGNRCFNRLTIITPKGEAFFRTLGLEADGSGMAQFRDEQVYSSVDYVHHKDTHLHAAIAEMVAKETV